MGVRQVVALGLAGLACCVRAIDTVDVDLSMYVGHWFQMYGDAFVFGTFERNAVCATADYSMNDDGTVAVFNDERVGSPDGPYSNISGTAVYTGKPGKFTVTFDTGGAPFPAPYWVVALGPVKDGQYQYSIVSDPLQTSLFVLARDPVAFKSDYDAEVLQMLADMGFDGKLNTPIELLQEGCWDDESTTTKDSVPTEASSGCMPVKPLANLDLTEYFRATWYSQQQQITGYQDLEDFYCVAATYDIQGATVPFFKGTVVSVYNYAIEGSVDGTPTNTANGTVLCARLEDSDNTGSLVVAPCFLPNAAAGPYWVLAVGEAADGTYDWAVISGGQPSVEYSDGCTTKLEGTNGSGLWIFTRDPVGNPDDIQAARDALTAMGFTLSQLMDVTQEDCSYPDAFIKPN